MKALALALLAAAAVVLLVRGRWSVATRGESTPPPMTAPDDIDWLSEYLTRSVPTGNAATAWRN